MQICDKQQKKNPGKDYAFPLVLLRLFFEGDALGEDVFFSPNEAQIDAMAMATSTEVSLSPRFTSAIVWWASPSSMLNALKRVLVRFLRGGFDLSSNSSPGAAFAIDCGQWLPQNSPVLWSVLRQVPVGSMCLCMN